MTAASQSTVWYSRQSEPGKNSLRRLGTLGVMAATVLELVPLKGVGPIALGAPRQAARAAIAAIGFPLEQSRDVLDYFCESSIQTECDADGRVMFIGLTCSPAFVVRYQGIDVFDVPAREVFARVAAADDSGKHDFDPLEYRFPNQVVTLWAADRQYDCRRKGSREIWGQVGLGNDVYVAAVRLLEDDG
jgi:hypothetical protein